MAVKSRLSFRLQGTDVFDEVVYLHQHKEAIGPESAERIGSGRMVERIQAVQTAAGRIDGQVTATDIAVEHQVAAVQGRTGQATHNTVQGYLGIIRCTDSLGGIGGAGRLHVQKVVAGHGQHTGNHKDNDFFHGVVFFRIVTRCQKRNSCPAGSPSHVYRRRSPPDRPHGNWTA